jgi:hypothetical protein
VSPAISSVPQFYPVPQRIFRHELSGKILSLILWKLTKLNISLYIESIDLQRQLHNPEPGMNTIGGWTGIFYRKDTDGKTR